MAGKSDDGGKDRARALTAILNSEIERIADLLPQVPLSHEDVAGLDRHARAIASVARAVGRQSDDGSGAGRGEPGRGGG